jgi:predicted  nucleic acid-binding Zn-ribbon protein
VQMLNADLVELAGRRKELLDELQMRENYGRATEQQLAEIAEKSQQQLAGLLREKGELENKISQLMV